MSAIIRARVVLQTEGNKPAVHLHCDFTSPSYKHEALILITIQQSTIHGRQSSRLDPCNGAQPADVGAVIHPKPAFSRLLLTGVFALSPTPRPLSQAAMAMMVGHGGGGARKALNPSVGD